MSSDRWMRRLLIVALTWALLSVRAREFNLGILVALTGHNPIGKVAAGTMAFAVRDANNDSTLTALRSGGHSLTYTWRDTRCSGKEGLKMVAEIWAGKGIVNHTIDAFIGPGCENICEAGALLSSGWGIPMISYGCTQTSLSKKSLYPSFARTQASRWSTGPMVAAIMKHYHWKRIIVIKSSDMQWDMTADQIEVDLIHAGLDVIGTPFFTEDADEEEEDEGYHEKIMQEMQQETRIYMIVTDLKNTQFFLDLAYKMGMCNGENAFITLDFIVPGPGEMTEHGVEVNLDAYEGVLDIRVDIHVSEDEKRNFLSRVHSELINDPFNDLRSISELMLDVNFVYGFMLYDAVKLYAIALNTSIAQGVALDDTMAISKRLRNVTIQHGDDTLYINEQGDAKRHLALRNLQNGSYVRLISYNEITGYLEIFNTTPIWPGGYTDKLMGYPMCGWDGEFCLVPEDNVMIIAISSAFGFILIVIVIVSGVHRYRFQKRLMKLINEGWKIPFSELHSLMKSTRSHYGSRFSKVSDDIQKIGYVETKAMLQDELQDNTIASYRGDLVRVNKVKKPSIIVNSFIIDEMKNVMNAKHGNIVPILGACIEHSHVCLISQYCSKGTLEDVLLNDSIRLDNIFKISFASDIASAMNYLHAKTLIKYHGGLSSTRIYVDGKWSCKITDFGLKHFREGEESTAVGTSAYYRDLLWTAPEHLRENALRKDGSQLGDSYSFGVVLHEILQREGTYGDYSEEPKEMINKLVVSQSPLFRPYGYPSDPESSELVDLMRYCWEESPAARPNFANIMDCLKKMNKGKQVNLVDEIISMLESYADNLEDLVTARTLQLENEKRKTDDLLSRMLPKSIADELKAGRTIHPEIFNSVTIFFSDIVGFTSMSASSTPLEVVNFLNDLYTTFDQIINQYDVYKVETIGDAYMVASGLPVRNGDRHAGEIATMALAMNSNVSDFKIKHRPESQLQMRMGVHTGSLCAGVVGLTMPRYCLFGDTVNYASRMESSGLALRIHVSPETKETLDILGGYHLELRGEVEMKGKGKINTYFLTGKDGFTGKQPDLARAAPMKDHAFK